MYYDRIAILGNCDNEELSEIITAPTHIIAAAPAFELLHDLNFISHVLPDNTGLKLKVSYPMAPMRERI